MEIFKDKRIKDTIIIGITLISLLEVYFAYKVFNDYRGIYQIGIFIPFIFQPFWYISLFKGKKTNLRFRIIGAGLISVVLPLVICFTLPNYTYKEGKQILKEYVKSNGDIEFIDYSTNKDTVPVFNDLKQLFVSNRAYYYGIKLTDGNKYFIVHPLTGRVLQMPKNFRLK